MIIYLYRWRLKEEKIEEFKIGWSYVTEQLREKCGSYGSRLQKGSDGLWYGYAQWPSAEHRSRASIDSPELTKARTLMKDAVIENLEDIILTPVADYLIYPGQEK